MKKLLLSLAALVLLVPNVHAANYNSDEAIKKEAAIFTLRAMLLHNEFSKSPEILKQKLESLFDEVTQKFALEHMAAYVTDPKIKKEATFLTLNMLEASAKRKDDRELLKQDVLALEVEVAQRVTPEEYATISKIVSDTLMQVNKMNVVFNAEGDKLVQQVKTEMESKNTLMFQKFCGFLSAHRELICGSLIGFVLCRICSNFSELIAL